MNCRHCQSNVSLLLIDLGSAPPSNAYLTDPRSVITQKRFPLRVLVCENCWLAQTEDFTGREELFDSDYAYFSSFSSSWLAHAEKFVAEVTDRFGLHSRSNVIEVAANDGYLLQYFKSRDIPCLGIEPTASTARAAREKGIEIVEQFFGTDLAEHLRARGTHADLMVANNVLAHVPDINDFVRGFSILLAPQGVATFEFPHLLMLVSENQFDTIYHEHFSYLSLSVVDRIFSANGLRVFDVETLATHGGSLRVFAQRADVGEHPSNIRLKEMLEVERRSGVDSPGFYAGFQSRAENTRAAFLKFLRNAKEQGKKVCAYGAAAKGNTLLNFASVGPELISFVVDRNPAKQGKFMPGSGLPIVDEGRLKAERPDYIVVLPWNLLEEVSAQLSYVREWDGKLVTAIPQLAVS